MLNETILEKLTERLVNRIEEANSYTLKLIGEQIGRIGSMTPTNANRLINVLKYGGDVDKIVKKLASVTNLNVKEIYEIFEEIAKKDLRFAKQFYDFKGTEYIPYEKNKALQQEVMSIARATAEQYLNLSNSTAIKVNGALKPIESTYQEVIDKAIITLNQGQGSYQELMKDTIKELGQGGIRTVNYESGYSKRLDSAIRMNIMDGMRDLHNRVQEIVGEEIGADGVEISVHENPAKDHEHIQGMQYSNEDYEKLNKELDRPISTMNCYHYIFSIVLGVSEPRYSKEELKAIREQNNKGFDFEDKHYSMYEGSQLQRRIETEIKAQKDIHTIAKSSGNLELVADSQTRIRQLAQKYKELSGTSGLPTKMDRLKVSGYEKTQINLKEYYENNLIGKEIDGIKITGLSSHFMDRRNERHINLEYVQDTLQNYTKKGIIKVDKNKDKSIQYKGIKSAIVINPDTGKLITVWRTRNKKKGDNK